MRHEEEKKKAGERRGEGNDRQHNRRYEVRAVSGGRSDDQVEEQTRLHDGKRSEESDP